METRIEKSLFRAPRISGAIPVENIWQMVVYLLCPMREYTNEDLRPTVRVKV